MPATVTVETLHGGQWLVLNRRELKAGMEETERANLIREAADLKVGWEDSNVFGDAAFRLTFNEAK